MHPAQAQLRSFCDGDLDPATAREVEEHVRNCEFCGEFCDEYRSLAESIEAAAEAPLPAEAKRVADYLYRAGFSGGPIVLYPFKRESVAAPVSLAADGPEKTGPRFENLATFFSEKPELVLRIMRDNQQHRDFLQLVSDDDSLISKVLVEVPDTGLSVITDENGRADFQQRYPDNAADLNWQIKMPEAEFSLQPLEYDPAKVEYSEDIVLETVRHDRVAIRFEGQKEGKRISIRILELSGHPDFKPVSVAVCQGGKSMIAGAGRDDILYFDVEGTESSIDIRLFRS